MQRQLKLIYVHKVLLKRTVPKHPPHGAGTPGAFYLNSA